MQSLVVPVTLLISVVYSATRLTIKGSKLYYPNDSEAILTGFNMLWDQSMPITNLDPSIAKSYFSKVNVARLVMVHWDDGKRGNPVTHEPYADCKTNNKSNGYLSDYCLNAFDEHIKWMQQQNIWSIITLRGEIAAGGNYPNQSDIFHNNTLKEEFISMWKFLANRYKNTDQIAAFEIMSEPRTDIALTSVASMYQETCNAIQNIDNTMLCMIGPSPYYHLCNLNETMIINSSNVIYNFNFFIPKVYVTATDVNYTIDWPGKMRCCDVTLHCLPGWCPNNNCNEYVNINKEWLKESINIPIKNFRDKFNKPVFVDQWGVHYNSNNRTGYTNDMLSLMIDTFNLSSTNWQWRGWEEDNYGIYHNLSNGSSFVDMLEVKEFQKFID